MDDKGNRSAMLSVKLIPEWIASHALTHSLPSIDVNTLKHIETPKLSVDGFELVKLPISQPGWEKIRDYAKLAPPQVLDPSKKEEFMELNRGRPFGAAQIIQDWLL